MNIIVIPTPPSYHRHIRVFFGSGTNPLSPLILFFFKSDRVSDYRTPNPKPCPLARWSISPIIRYPTIHYSPLAI